MSGTAVASGPTVVATAAGVTDPVRVAPRPRAVVFAFACEPGRGSEPGAGWGVVRALAATADCTVLVGPEHADGTRRWLETNPDAAARIRFVVAPEAPWPRRAGRGRYAWFIAYLRWLPNAERVARRLHAEWPFDVAVHASYSTYWLPTPAVSLGIPSVWGPVGGAVTTPLALWPALGARGVVGEVVDRVAVRLFALRPATRRAWRAATVRLLQNEETRDRLPSALRARARVLNHALLTDVPPAPEQLVRGRDVLFAAALDSRKGPRLAMRAVAYAPPDVRLTVVGDGPERRALERLAARLGAGDRVAFLGLVPRDRLFALLDTAAAALFTGLREEGGLALAEAMMRGVPVVVLANGGARTIAAASADPARVALIRPGRVDETARRLAAAMTRFSREPSAARGPTLDQAAATRKIGDAVREALGVPATTPRPCADGRASAASVCVVIPAYNAARYLDEAARSVLAQTHRALELLIVDDGSADDTLAVARAIDDSRVRTLTRPNGGRARARNVGALAAGPSTYIAFLDADDVWDEHKLEQQVAWLDAHPDAVGVGSRMRYVSSSGRMLGQTGQAIDDAAHALVTRAELAPFPVSSCLVVRRAAFDAIGGFDPVLREAEDLEFMAQLARRGRVGCVPEVLGSYRIHPDSAMARRRLVVNQYARFVRQRLRARDAGGELTWEAFVAAYAPTWRERWQDRAEVWYRSAALWYGEGRRWRALRFGVLAALAAPRYTARRVYRQRGARAGAGTG